MAKASNAILIGFNIRPNNSIKDYAKENGVEIRLYDIIYKAVEEMEAAMKGMLDPEYEEKVIGTAEIRKIFKFSKVGNIAGSYVTDGIIKRDSKVRIIRDSVVIYDGNIASIQREKDAVKEVKKGLECGITFITDEKKKEALVIVDNDNLSLAIGKKGCNVKLASRLTHYKIDVKTKEQAKEMGINIVE